MLFLGMLFFQTCVEKRAESFQKEVKGSTETIKAKTNFTNNIPSLNFKELEPLLNKKNDTLYVVNFWATWCKPCIKELPAFEKINSDYKLQKVKVLLVSLDFPEQLEKQVIPFIEKRQIKSKVILLDDPYANTWIPKVSPKWSGAIPATLIYNKTERKFYERSFAFEELETEITSILNK